MHIVYYIIHILHILSFFATKKPQFFHIFLDMNVFLSFVFSIICHMFSLSLNEYFKNIITYF